MTVLKAFRLEKGLANRLTKMARASKRSEKYYVEEALRLLFEEYEDLRVAKERAEDPNEEYISGKELRKRLGI